MGDYRWCPDCRSYHSGQCPPPWRCYDEEYDSTAVVNAWGPETAAELAAERMDSDACHYPDERTIRVTGADGEATTCTVPAETVRVYRAEVTRG